jgi:hypothetical protein
MEERFCTWWRGCQRHSGCCIPNLGRLQNNFKVLLPSFREPNCFSMGQQSARPCI